MPSVDDMLRDDGARWRTSFDATFGEGTEPVDSLDHLVQPATALDRRLARPTGAGGRRRPVRRPGWTGAAVAAAVVLLVVLVSFVVARRPGDDAATPPSPSVPATGSALPSESPTVSTPSSAASTPAPATGALPWHGAWLVPPSASAPSSVPVVVAGRSYVSVGQDQIDRVAIGGGQMTRLATARTVSPLFVVQGGSVWGLLRHGDGVAVTALDPTSLIAGRSTALPSLDPPGVAALLAAGPHLLAVVGRSTVYLVDTSSDSLVRTVELPSTDVVSSAVVGMAGQVLFLGVDEGQDTVPVIRSVDLVTRTLLPLSVAVHDHPHGGVGVLAASAGGLFFGVGEGIGKTIYFAAYTDLSQQTAVETAGGGIAGAASDLGSVTVVAGSHTISCIDSETGVVRATESLRQGTILFSLARSAGHLAAVAQVGDGPQLGLAELNLPSPCNG